MYIVLLCSGLTTKIFDASVSEILNSSSEGENSRVDDLTNASDSNNNTVLIGTSKAPRSTRKSTSTNSHINKDPSQLIKNIDTGIENRPITTSSIKRRSMTSQ